MNKKIFTLLVGACMLVGSLFTVNAQRRKPYSDKVPGVQSTNFNDILTADTVKKLPGTEGYFYLLSVTGLANPESDAVSQRLFTTLGKSPNGALSPVHSVDSSIVLYVDDNGTTTATLRLEDLATLDSAYNFGATLSNKFNAIRRASWCLSYTQSSVAGSNVTFDFQNMETGRFLEAPIFSDFDHTDWNINPSHSYTNAMYNKPIDQYNDDMIVSGWHFSQTYLPSQYLQTGMPLYSYVKPDTVAVLVLNPDEGYVSASGGNTGGYTVSVKHVAAQDLIRDASGNVHLNSNTIGVTPNPKAITNVLLFTIKKVNKFVMNADDWNTVNDKKLLFDENANTTVINGNPATPGVSYSNPFTEQVLTAEEVNDSLYHYGYMQFSRPTTTSKEDYLFVDTAFVNYGNDQYLAFGWSLRRDSTEYGQINSANSILWGNSYGAAKPHLYGDRYCDPTGATLPYEAYLYYDSVITMTGGWPFGGTDHGWWIPGNTIRYSFITQYGGGYIATIPTSVPTTPDASWATAFAGGVGCAPSTPVPANYYGSHFYLDSMQWLADSVSYLLSYMKDSLMENQSKFRVVYDPFADSTFINVYQTRVRYPDLTNASIGKTVWPNWWENSFMLKSSFNTHVLSGYYGGGAYVRPSDVYTNALPGDLGSVIGLISISMTDAAANYYNTIVKSIPAHASSSVIRRSDAGVTNLPHINIEQHGNLDVLIDNEGYNFHSLMIPFEKSTVSFMDKVMISTADTCAIYEEYYAHGYNPALAHMYGWSLTTGTGVSGQPKYRDSLFYVDIQSLDKNTKRIITLDQSYKAGVKGLDTKIEIAYGPKCKDDPTIEKATLENDLYLIRNELGEYLTIPVMSIADSVYWATPREGEDPTRIPAYQWAVINVRDNTKHSPFRLINREFERVEFPYVYVYENQAAPFQFAPGSVHVKPSFNTENVFGGSTKKEDAIGQNPVNAEDFVTEMEQKIPLSSGISFIRLNDEVKTDQLLGYKYIDRDSTVVDVYAFRYLHGLGSDMYMSWRGYDYDPSDPTSVKDTAIYIEGNDYYSKLFFDLQEMTDLELYPYDSKYKQGKVVLTAGNVSKDSINADFAGLYKKFASKERKYTNADSIVLERFGFYESGKIENLKPLARQAYRLFLKDYYRWHPTLKGHYMTVGSYDKYILADRAYAAKKYVRGSDRVEGLFGIPHFYFRNVYFDVDNKSGNDFFTLIQRLDTMRTDLPTYDYGHPYPGVYEDINEWLIKRFGSVAAGPILEEIYDNHEFQVLLPVVRDNPWRLEMAVRGEAGVRLSTFQLEQDNDPIYRRFHVNEPNEKFGDELWNTDLPDTLQFHLHNEPDAGRRLYENSGGYRSNDNTVTGPCGGRPHNVINGDYKRDSLGHVISYLGINWSTEYPNTNYAFYLDTAYVNRGTGWIKPQYMLVVDPYKPLEGGDCDPGTGEIIPVNQNFVIGRYLFNSAMYSKEVKDSVLNADYIWEYTDKFYDASKSNGIEYAENKFASGYRFKSDNYSKVQPIKTTSSGLLKNSPYLTDREWERLAFAWAIHKGDSLYVLKNLEPMFEGKDNDPVLVWKELVKQYGVSSTANGDYVDFDRLIEENTASTYVEAYYPNGNRGMYPEMRTYRTFKSVSGTDKIGLHAIIDLGDNTHKDWVFSMRYIERNSSDFVIESETTDRDTRNGAVIRPGYGGWVKFQNQVPVITRSDEKEIMAEAYGAVFNVKRLHQAPVSNEGVDAGNTEVTVIGGTGSVTILNATGKNVVISNILGQTVANTKLNSDNASISVPAGIVVVSVEGEKSSKVLVK